MVSISVQYQLWPEEGDEFFGIRVQAEVLQKSSEWAEPVLHALYNNILRRQPQKNNNKEQKQKKNQTFTVSQVSMYGKRLSGDRKWGQSN